MRTIVHASDLHMGRLDPQVLSPLIEAIRAARADLVVISGDFTQRATEQQFRSARAFLDAVDRPTLSIPGNHDVPLWNVAARFLTPLDRYRRHISRDLSPEYLDDEVIVVGLNTARSFTWGEGRINLMDVQRVRERLAAAPPHVIRIVVTHHPFDLPPGVHEKRLVGRARLAMAQLAAGGADLFLSGHLHLSHISHSAERYRIAGHSALIVHAGTVSMRGRGEEPSFNLLRLDRGRLEIARFLWSPAKTRFEESAFGTYRRERDGWIAEEISADPPAAPES
jgi:3',5'-cyclic AMP phosphodiesterase CpdA